MTTIFAVDCSPLYDRNKLEAALVYSDSARRQRIARLATNEKKAQCAAAGWLLTTLLGDEGTPPPLFHGSRGKPYLAGCAERYFNLAHTGRWVFCAVCEQEIGMDAQISGPHNPRVADRCFTPSEIAWLESDPDGRFTRLWALKEAYLKYTGFGLVLPMSSFTVPLPADGWDADTRCYWQERVLRAGDDTIFVAVCTASDAPVAPIQILTLPPLCD